MTKEQIQNAFQRLGQILHERQVMGEIAVFGGAAVVLGFDFHRATQDVDSLITEGHGQVIQAARQVEREQHLPSNWLNEQATSYLSRHNDFSFFKMYPSEGHQSGLRVLMAKPEYLLAMKLLSFRLYGYDVEDIIHLARLLNRTSEDDLLSLLKDYYPDEQVSPARTIQITNLVRQIHASPNS